MNILKKKQAGEIKTISEIEVYSELLGEDIKIVKRPLSVYMGIMAKHDAVDESSKVDMSSMIPMINEMMYEFCPMFKEPDAVKEALAFYDVPTARDLPEVVFEGNVKELMQIFEAIGEFYDVDSLDDDIKN